MTESSYTSPHQALQSRFLNMDGVGLVRERLVSSELLEMCAWFSSPLGGDNGERFARQAPVFDAMLERFWCKRTGLDEAFSTVAAESSFVSGLTVGSFAQVLRDQGEPHFGETEIERVLLALADPNFLCLLLLNLPEEAPAGRTMQRLVALDPGLRVIVDALLGLGSAGFRAPADALAMRLSFCYGLLGAGIRFRMEDVSNSPSQLAGTPDPLAGA